MQITSDLVFEVRRSIEVKVYNHRRNSFTKLSGRCDVDRGLCSMTIFWCGQEDSGRVGTPPPPSRGPCYMLPVKGQNATFTLSVAMEQIHRVTVT